MEPCFQELLNRDGELDVKFHFVTFLLSGVDFIIIIH